MTKFVRKKELETPVTKNVNYSEVNDASDTENKAISKEQSMPQGNGFQFKKTKAKPYKKTDESSVKEQGSAQITAVNAKKTETDKSAVKTRDWDSTNKVLPKFVNKSAKSPVGTAVEFSKSALNLCDRNEDGYRDSLDGKFMMNFWTFDKDTNKMLNYIPTYINTSEWLNVCHMILSGRLHEETEIAREKQSAGGYQYCNFIYQNIGGSYKEIFKINGKPFGGKNGNPIATIFKITPAMKDGNWILSTEIYEGIRGETGLIEPIKGNKMIAQIRVSFSYSDLVRVARMSEIAIQAHMIRMQ